MAGRKAWPVLPLEGGRNLGPQRPELLCGPADHSRAVEGGVDGANLHMEGCQLVPDALAKGLEGVLGRWSGKRVRPRAGDTRTGHIHV